MAGQLPEGGAPAVPSEWSGDTRRLRIHAFPEGEHLWRVDWFGPIAFPNRFLKSSEPSVLVHLSKVTDPAVLEDPTRPVQPSSTTCWPTKRWVSIGTTLLLRVGDLWEGRLWHSRPTHQVEQFEGVVISKQTAQIVKAGSSLESGGFLIPVGEHPWHMGNTHSYCVRVTLADGRYLVVPAMELIRFYFGSSSALLSRLFSPPLTKERLFESMLLGAAQRMQLDLADGIPGTSATDVARIAGDPLAWFAAQNIGVSCVAASTRKADVYPIGLFPFMGRTDLKVHGTWLSRGGEKAGTFLVFSIASCSHAFPFRSLAYRVKNARPRRQRWATATADTKQAPVPKSAAVRPRAVVVVELDGTPKLSKHAYAFDSGRAFPDLKRKPVSTRAPLEGGQGNANAGANPGVDKVGSGEPTSSQRIRTVGFVEQVASKPEPIPEFLQSAVDACSQLSGITVHLLTDSSDDGWTIPAALPTSVDDDGVIDTSLLIQDGGTLRPRRLGAFLLERGEDRLTTVFIESEPQYPLAYPSERGDVNEANAILACATKDFARRVRTSWSESPAISVSPRDPHACRKICEWLEGHFHED